MIATLIFHLPGCGRKLLSGLSGARAAQLIRGRQCLHGHILHRQQVGAAPAQTAHVNASSMELVAKPLVVVVVVVVSGAAAAAAVSALGFIILRRFAIRNLSD